MKWITAILTPILLFPALLCMAQADSLLHLLQTTKPDTGKARLLLDIGDAFQFERHDFEAAKRYYRQAGSLSTQLHYSAGQFKYLFYYLDVLVQQNQFDSSLYYSKQAMALAAREQDSASYIHAVYTSAVSYSGLAAYPAAIQHFITAADYYARKQLMDKLAMCYNELTIVYRHTGQFDNAIQYGNAAVKLYEKYRSLQQTTSPLQNLASVYQTMQQPEKAVPLLQRALIICKNFKDEYSELTIMSNLADISMNLRHFTETPAYFNRLLALSRKLSNKDLEATGYYDAGYYYLLKGNPEKAWLYADSALQSARKLKDTILLQQSFALLAKSSYATHHYSQALAYDQQLNLAQEAINTANINRSIIELQTKYETVKKEGRIHALEAKQHAKDLELARRNAYTFLLLVLLGGLSISGLLVYRNSKRKQQLLETEKQLQQQQITTLKQEQQLSATAAILRGQEEERTRIARDLHDGLGGILSSAKYSLYDMKDNMVISHDNTISFERTIGILDQSITELRRVAHNMMPESLLNQPLDEALRDFCQHISSSGILQIDYLSFGLVTASFDNTYKIMIYRMIQELVNNILKHAHATTALVQLIYKDNFISITVEDNGTGFNTGSLQQATGMGYKNLKSRVEYLKGKMDIQSGPDKGTSILIEIPV